MNGKLGLTTYLEITMAIIVRRSVDMNAGSYWHATLPAGTRFHHGWQRHRFLSRRVHQPLKGTRTGTLSARIFSTETVNGSQHRRYYGSVGIMTTIMA